MSTSKIALGSPARNRASARWGGTTAAAAPSKLSWGTKKGRTSTSATSSYSYTTLYLCTCCTLVGYLVGFLHSRIMTLNNSEIPSVDFPMAADTSINSQLSIWQGKEFHEGSDGWKSIHVHYGTRQHLIESPAIKNEMALSSQNNTTWFSQARQDEIVAALLNHKKSGFFVDLAANDATHWSNTYALERSFGWNGLCIEPNPIYWKNLSYRTCTVVGAVVGGSQRQDDVYFRYEAGTHGGIADEGFDNNRKWQKSSQHESMVPLLEVFQKAQVPRVIDYLSLDVEGAETLILTNFPLQDYRIQIITAERLKGPIRVFLKEHGYEFIKKITRWGESLWVHRDSIPHLNMKALDAISFPVV